MELILITTPEIFGGEIKKIKLLFAAGLARLQVRKPALTAQELASWLGYFSEEEQQKMWLHSHYQLVEEFPIGGIHHPEKMQRSTTIKQRGWLQKNHPHLKASLALHDLERAKEEQAGYDDGFISPLFTSISKPDHQPSLEARNLLEEVTETNKVATLPLIALGGCQQSNLAQIKNLGFQKVALLGAIWGAIDPVKAFQENQETALTLKEQ